MLSVALRFAPTVIRYALQPGSRPSREPARGLRCERDARETGSPSLPHITPHILRRTYISIALLANNFDVVWGMNQVGHVDSKMTLEVYAQLQQRAKRDHGAASTGSSATPASS